MLALSCIRHVIIGRKSIFRIMDGLPVVLIYVVGMRLGKAILRDSGVQGSETGEDTNIDFPASGD